MSRQADRIAAIERALTHHGADKVNGIVHSYSAPYAGRSTWLIYLHALGTKHYTTAQADAICDALAAAESYQGYLAALAAQ